MSRKPAGGAKEFANKFVLTPYNRDNGVYGKMYSVVLPHCKVLMQTRHRQQLPQIEMIKFPNVLLIAEPSIWENSFPCYSPQFAMSELINSAKNIQFSKEIHTEQQGAILQLGNNKIYIAKIETEPRTIYKVNAASLTSSASSKGKTIILPIKESVNKVDDAIAQHFSDEAYIINGNMLMSRANDNEVPTLNNYFSKAEMDLIDNRPSMNGSFINEESYHSAFGYVKSPEYQEAEILIQKSDELRQKLASRRSCESLRYRTKSFIWRPGCEAISNSPNNIYIRGPWSIEGKNREDIKKSLENWHILYAI